MHIALIVPVLNRFDLFAQLIRSVDIPIRPIIIDNWVENRGVAAAWNEGMRMATDEGYKYAIIANDDSYFLPRTIERLYSSMRDTGAALVSPNPNNQHAPSGLIEGADFCNFMTDIPQLLDNCGTFDENFRPAYFEDNDMHYRIRLSGRACFINTDAVVHHYGSKTQYFDPNSPVCPPHQFEQNRQYYREKWGGEPGRETCLTPYGSPNHTIKDWDRR